MLWWDHNLDMIRCSDTISNCFWSVNEGDTHNLKIFCAFEFIDWFYQSIWLTDFRGHNRPLTWGISQLSPLFTTHLLHTAHWYHLWLYIRASLANFACGIRRYACVLAKLAWPYSKHKQLERQLCVTQHKTIQDGADSLLCTWNNFLKSLSMSVGRYVIYLHILPSFKSSSSHQKGSF